MVFPTEKLDIFVKRLTEATPSCLMTMVQGDVAAISLGHWIKAFEVGSLTGVIAVALSFCKQPELQDNKYVIAGVTGFITAISDFVLHPSHFGGPSTEAIVTGVGAGLLCLALSQIRKVG